MTTITNHTEYTAAVNEAKLHDYRYFTLNAPTITDEEYDRLYFAIQDYETAHPAETLADSPTQSAHGEVKNGHKQIRRRTEMLSTEKAQTIEKVQKWMQKTTKKTGEALYTVEWKYDGISLSLVYIDGQLTEASYGKGMEGNDCLAHCLKVASIPNTIPASGRVEVRGEMVVPFANLAQTGYKNCRSAASGIMADTASTLTDCLEFHPYWTDMDASELSVEKPFGTMKYGESLAERFAWLTDNGFIGSGADLCSADCIERVIARFEDLRSSQSFPTDGLVIKVADITKWDSLGRNDHHPHYAIAYKFAAATAETTITRIEITTGKTGKRTPVAYFEPITINGATYQKASIGSEAKLAELGIVEGSRVIVSLRNDVIPHIDYVMESAEIEEVSVSSVCSIEENQHAEYSENTEDVSLNSCNSYDKEKESAQFVPSVVEEEDEPDIAPITPYIAPAAAPVTVVNEEPICAPVLSPLRYESVTECRAMPPVRNQRKPSKRNYRMAGEQRAHVATTSTRGDSLVKNFIAYTIALVAVVAVCYFAFALIGAAIFFTPLLAGAFK